MGTTPETEHKNIKKTDNRKRRQNIVVHTGYKPFSISCFSLLNSFSDLQQFGPEDLPGLVGTW